MKNKKVEKQTKIFFILNFKFFIGKSRSKFPVTIRVRVTPIPIPNMEVKTHTVDGTWLVTARESRRLPEQHFCTKQK